MYNGAYLQENVCGIVLEPSGVIKDESGSLSILRYFSLIGAGNIVFIDAQLQAGFSWRMAF